MIKIALGKIKEGKEEKLRAWARELQGHRKAEALETLKHENIYEETMRIIDLEGQKYCLMFADSRDKELLPSDPSIPLNREHRAVIKDCIEKWIEGEEISRLKRGEA